MPITSICFMNSNKPWGGGEKWHYDFARLCRDHGMRVLVVTNQPSELAEKLRPIDGIEVFSLPVSSLSFLNPFKRRKLKNKLREFGVQAMVMALPADVKLGGLAAKAAGVDKIIYRRGIGVATKNTALNRHLLGQVITHLIINSQNTGRTILAHNPDMVPKENIHLVHCGFDVAEFDRFPVQPLIEKRPGEVLIGNAGRLTHQKGQKHLIEAARILKDRGLSFRVLIAGKGELEEELKGLANDLDVTDCVEFLGFVSDMKSFNAYLDIFALSSLFEGFCYAQVEAMVCEKPVVAFDVSSIPEVVSDGVTGYLVPEADSAAFAHKLEELIRDPELRARMGKAGRERVINEFEMMKTFRDFLAVLDK